jgi:hypothetical protein
MEPATQHTFKRARSNDGLKESADIKRVKPTPDLKHINKDAM